jgi:acetyl esterase
VSVAAERARHATQLRRVKGARMAEQRDVAVGRLYRPTDARGGPALVFFHGGGWYLGSVDAYDPIAQRIAAASGVTVISCETRPAPEHPFPAAVNDAVAACGWVLTHREELEIGRVGVAGDSSGGNLAAVAARHAQGLAAQVLIYAALDLRETPPPERGSDHIERYLDGANPADPDASPMAAELSGLPPALIVNAEHDWLRALGDRYADRLRAAGVPARTLDFPGQHHAFLAWASPAELERLGGAIWKLMEETDG